MFALQPVGGSALEAPLGLTTQEQLVELVLERYEVTADRAAPISEEFLEQLRQLRALESED